jgi:hypothetical protein
MFFSLFRFSPVFIFTLRLTSLLHSCIYLLLPVCFLPSCCFSLVLFLFSFFRRQFEVQVQGKFKREPQGEIYVGAEASNKMELGILTRSIGKAAMKFCSTMVDDLHWSYGDTQENNPDYELPHVVAPIFPTLDKIVLSPDGEQPQPLGIPFNEDLEYRKKRLKGLRFIKDADVNMQTSYSFSVNTSNLDLLTWTLVGIPMVRPMDLRTFFGSSSINLSKLIRSWFFSF